MMSLKPTPIWDGYRRGRGYAIAGIADIARHRKNQKHTAETQRRGGNPRSELKRVHYRVCGINFLSHFRGAPQNPRQSGMIWDAVGYKGKGYPKIG
jgi:hypothetical protein